MYRCRAATLDMEPKAGVSVGVSDVEREKNELLIRSDSKKFFSGNSC